MRKASHTRAILNQLKAMMLAALVALPAAAQAATKDLPVINTPEGDLAVRGIGHDWQLYFQHPASEIMDRLYHLSIGLHVVAAVISVFVLGLLLIVILRFNEKRNPTPSRTTHNTAIEIAWTVIPILVLVAIAIPSLRLHYKMSYVEKPEMTLKVTGLQWYWHYDYPDNGNFGFDAYIIKDEDIKKERGDVRLLSTDNKVIIPVDTTVRVLMTGADVIHSWSVPAFGVKRDAIPGRLNETWFRADRTGVFYGQCSQLCGVSHGFMPIEVHVVSKEAFAKWAAEAKTKYAQSEPEGSKHFALLDWLHL